MQYQDLTCPKGSHAEKALLRKGNAFFRGVLTLLLALGFWSGSCIAADAISTLDQERATYDKWGWKQASGAEPTSVAERVANFTVVNPEIDVDTATDDLWTYLMMYQRSGNPVYLNRANAWALYFKTAYQPCLGTSGNSSGCAGRTYSGREILLGWGLLDYYRATSDADALGRAMQLGAALESLYMYGGITECAPLDVCNKGGMRAIASHLLFATRLAEVSPSLRWTMLRNVVIGNLLSSDTWDARDGMYFLGEEVTDQIVGAGSYGGGARIASASDIALLAEAMYQAYQASGNENLRTRLIAMARYVSANGLDTRYSYAGRYFGLVAGRPWHDIAQNDPVVYWETAYTTRLVNTLVYGYKLTADAALLDKAKLFFLRGTRGVASSPSEPVTEGIVMQFVDTRFDAAREWRYLTQKGGVLAYTYRIFEGAGTPAVAQVAPDYYYLTRDGSGALVPMGAASLPAGAVTRVLPSPPSNPKVMSVAGTSVTFGWSASVDGTGISGYLIERCQGDQCTDFRPLAAAGALNHRDQGLLANQHYRYRLRAVSDMGDISDFSDVVPVQTIRNLAYLATSMRAGQWLDITYDVGGSAVVRDALTSVPGSTITEWADKGVWNPVHGRFLFVGASLASTGPLTAEKAIALDGESNAWTLAAPDVPFNYSSQKPAYQHNAVDAKTGDLYYRPYSSRNLYRMRNGVWSARTAIPTTYVQTAGALEGFPERRRVLFVDGDWGVLSHHMDNNTWVRLANTNKGGSTSLPTLQMGSLRNVAVYNPKHKIVLFGGGYGSSTLYRMDQQDRITFETTAPSVVAVGESIFTVDPASGNYLLIAKDKSFWAYDPEFKIWGRIASSVAPPFLSAMPAGLVQGVVSMPVSSYGVVMFTRWLGDDSKVYLYKHSSSDVTWVDASKPTVSLTSPANGSTVSGSQIVITANATDNVAVRSVQFKVDGLQIGSIDTTAPYAVTWNSALVANGSRVISATATDIAGNSSTASRTVTVSNTAVSDTTAPTVTVTSPKAGATVSGSISVTASATDAVGVAGVEFFVDGVKVGAEDTTAPYAIQLDTGLLRDGSRSFTAVARDRAGNRRTASAVVVTVRNASAVAAANSIGAIGAQISTGSWGEVLTNNITETLGMSGGSAGFHVVYADDFVWHSAGQKAYFIGGDRGRAMRFVSYDANTGAWSQLPSASWMPNPAVNSGVGPHGYDQLALDEGRGLLYYRVYGGTVYRYRIAEKVWSELPATTKPASATCCDALSYFPELDGVIRVRATGELLLYRESSNSWTVLSSSLAKGGTWMYAEYNPVHKVVVFGNPSAGTMYKVDARGIVTRLRDPYVSFYDGSASNGVFSVDPKSGAYLLLTASTRAMYSYDVVTDTWAEVPAGNRPDLRSWGLIATPIKEAGVTLYAGCRQSTVCRAYVYKHDASRPPDTTAPTVGMTSPTSAATLSGQVSLTASATDNVGVAGVQFYVNGQPFGSEVTAPPYTRIWNTTWLGNGSHKVRVRARDVAGNTVTTPDMSVNVSNAAPAVLAPADYATRCQSAGVIRCYGFDDLGDLTGGHPRLATYPVDSTTSRMYDPSSGGAAKCTGGKCWALDTAVKAGGNSALRFEVPTNTPADGAGSFRLNFRDDLTQQIGEGEEFYVQYRQRFSPEMLRTFKATGGKTTAWKQSIIGLGDRPAGSVTTNGRTIAYSCTAEEMVFVQNTRYMGPTFYHGCGYWTKMEYRTNNLAQIQLQHVGDPYCYYPDDPTRGCFRYAANEWMTFKIHVRVVGWGTTRGNRVRMWAARQGKPSVLIFDSINSHPNGFPLHHTDAGAKFGKIWLTPYMTAKDSTEVHPTLYTWYDELIISRQDIPDPK